MECPRCGFQQPLDDYCARCGVNISSAFTRRQRKTLLALLTTLFVVVAGGLYLALWLSKQRGDSVSSLPLSRQSTPSFEQTEPPARTMEPPLSTKEMGALPERPEPPAQDAVPSTMPPDLEAPPSSTAPSDIPQPLENPLVPEPEEVAAPTDLPLESDPEHQIRRWAAQEWFNLGQELADFSVEELAYYQKALEVDPHFALAQYYMGLIHWEWGEREAAMEVFRQFWRDATQEEREIYVLPEEIRVDELELSSGTE